MTTPNISPIPKDPISSIHDPNWENAMLDEYNALIANNTWELVPRPPDVNVIRSMWIFHHKRLSDGSFERHKVRLVGDGKTQRQGIDCDETFSLVIKLDSDMAYILLYVDDIILTTSSDHLRQQFMTLLGNEFAMKDLGPLSFFLGIVVTCNASGIFLSQKQYSTKIIDKIGMDNCSSCPTPADTKPKLSASKDTPYEDPTKYRSLAGALYYSLLPDLTSLM
ncbi:uncharacterized protein LOC110707409 [Chenopodium quinoa]|uniref:uncharacterized protein LOC110707409 n=1 Tax=Chenopodium quinoa TaxID=63459 RepID=UPI000B76D9CE|nr:uncharacterized protein LOC110707409 [Chenopodium quinoa]